MCKPCKHHPHIRTLLCKDCHHYVCRDCARSHNTVLSQKLLASHPKETPVYLVVAYQGLLSALNIARYLMTNIYEWRNKYRKWWQGKLIKCNSGIKRVRDINLYGPPSFVYGDAEFVFEDNTTCLIHTSSFKPRKCDVEVIPENVNN